MKPRFGWGAGIAALGAGLMALLDPQVGKRRRALLRDKANRAAHSVGDFAGMTWRDLSHRASGVAAGARGLVRGEEIPDEVLAERVRSKIGRLVSHPASIQVTAAQGRVTLAGPILEREVKGLLRGVKAIRGVTGVEDRLEIHEQAGNVSGLQGGKPAPEHRFELLQENWSPTARLLAGTAGAGLALVGARRRGWLGGSLAAIGSGVFLRAVTNLPAKRLFGIGPARRGIDICKSIAIDAPVEEVFALWSRWENFPRFFSHVREVRDHGEGRTHWKVAGPAGTVMEWDAVVTASIPNQLLSWKSSPGEAVRHAGTVRFDPTPEGGTRVDLRMTYKPPAGAIGHAVAALFGSDPKTALDEDMVRVKSLLEEGATSAQGREVTRKEVIPAAEPPSPARRRPSPEPPGAAPMRRGKRPDA